MIARDGRVSDGRVVSYTLALYSGDATISTDQDEFHDPRPVPPTKKMPTYFADQSKTAYEMSKNGPNSL